MSNRIRIAEVCEITGMHRRHAQQMAKKGKIPSAALYGRLWTFDREAVKKWAKIKEEPSWQTTTSTVEARPGGVEFRLPGRTYAAVYEQALKSKRASGSRSGKTR